MANSSISKIELLYNFKCSPSLLETSSVNFSKRNCISAITSKGVYILSLNFRTGSPGSQMTVHKQLIENTKEPLIFPIHNKAKEYLEDCQFDLDSRHKLMLDSSFYKGSPNNSLYRSYRLALWSPGFESILALLTFDGRILLYVDSEKQYTLFKDISSMLAEDTDLLLFQSSSDYVETIAPFHKVAIQALVWTDLYYNESGDGILFLIVGSKTGLISCFQLNIAEKIIVNLVNKWESGLQDIISLKWHKSYLIISTSHGLVQMVHPHMELDTKSPITMDMSARVAPWTEKDDLPVHHITAFPVDKNNFLVVFAKGMFIIVCSVEETTRARKLILVNKRVVAKEAIYRMPCSGISYFKNRTMYMSSLDGRIIEVHVGNDIEHIFQREILLEDIPQNNMCTYGIDSSLNGVYMCMARTLTTYHDHLAITEPTHISLFTTLSFDELVNRIKSLLVPNEENNCLQEYCDLLICFDSFLSVFNLWVPDQFDEIKQNNFDFNSNTFQLKMLRFVCYCLQNLNHPKLLDENGEFIYGEVAKKLEEGIMKRWAENCIKSYANSNEYRVSVNSCINKKMSLNNMRLWLQLNDDKIIKIDLQGEFKEMCPICEQEITFCTRERALCPNNHHFGRCSQSLLICDNVCYEYKVCKFCSQSLCIQPSVWSKLTVCMFCD